MKKQKKQNLLTAIIIILVIVLGVIIAMLFVGNEDISKKLEKHQNKNTINTVQTQS